MGTRYDGSKAEKRALNAYINLMRASESIAHASARRVAESGLTLSQFGVLEALYHLGPMSQKMLGGKLLKTSGNVTMVVDNLEKRALVLRRRGRDDRRFVSVRLTPKGRRLIKRVLPVQVQGIAEDLSRLSDEEQIELRRLCRILGKGKE